MRIKHGGSWGGNLIILRVDRRVRGREILRVARSFRDRETEVVVKEGWEGREDGCCSESKWCECKHTHVHMYVNTYV